MTTSFSTSMLQAAKTGSQAIVELVLPPVCRLCMAPVNRTDDFCRGCERALRVSEASMRNACPRCGMPRPARGQPQSAEIESSAAIESPEKQPGFACAGCRTGTFRCERVTALWAYQDRVCEAIVAAKFPQQAALGHVLGVRLGVVLRERFPTDLPDLVTFVPSHLTRLVSRGGNGAAVIASAVAGEIRRPCRPLLRTTRPIAKQAWLDDRRRLRNVQGAFAMKRSYAFPRTPDPLNRHILLVDDVLTTGATANEVARVLHDSGVKRVSLAVVARAMRSR